MMIIQRYLFRGGQSLLDQCNLSGSSTNGRLYDLVFIFIINFPGGGRCLQDGE